MATASKAAEQQCLEGSTPSLSADMHVPLAERQGGSLPNCLRWVQFPQGTLGNRLTGSRLALTQQTWVRLPLPGLRRPGTPMAGAARLKPGCLWVRLPLWVQLPPLGRQLADQSDSDSDMLWVRIPPERLVVSVEQPGVLACLSRRRSWVQIPSGTLSWHGTQIGKASKLKPCCRVGSIPTRATHQESGIRSQESIGAELVCHRRS